MQSTLESLSKICMINYTYMVYMYVLSIYLYQLIGKLIVCNTIITKTIHSKVTINCSRKNTFDYSKLKTMKNNNYHINYKLLL